jgi:hypothetical protein
MGQTILFNTIVPPLLAFKICSCPLHENKPIPQETIEARNKLKSEAPIEEQKIILGWLINFCQLLIHLPENKFFTWLEAIRIMIKDRASTAKEIEANIGCLVYLGLAIPFVHHFMSQLRDLHTTSKGRGSIKIKNECLKDLEVFLGFLKIANNGISLNSIALWRPTHIYRSDLYPAGLGGYSNEVWAWSWYLPSYLLFRALNNLLKHLATIISPWVGILAGHLKNQDCVLLMTNSTTAEGWLKKTYFSKFGKSLTQASIRIEAAWKQATLVLSLGIKCYSQWFKRERNQILDNFSCDDDRRDKELTSAIKSFCPSQVPSHFKILQLPKEMTLWLTVFLLKFPVSMQLRKEHTRSKIGCGSGGRNTAIQLESRTISSSKLSPENTDTSSLAHLPWLSGKQGFSRASHE